MLLKLIFYALLAAAQTRGSEGADNNQQAPSTSPQFLDLPSFDTKSIVGQPTTINHKSFIDHVASGTGSASGNGGSSHATGTRSSTLLNKAIAAQGAASDPVMIPSSYTNVQASPPGFSIDPFGISSVNYASNGIFSAGLFGTSFDKAVESIPSVLSSNSHIDYNAPGSIYTVPNGIPSLNNNKDGNLPSGFFNATFDKINIPVPEVISVSVSSSIDEDTSVSIPSSPVKMPTVNYANNGILSTGKLGTSLGKDVISIPNALSLNPVSGHGAAGSIAAVPVKVSSSVGPAESSFFSSPVKVPTVNYANNGIHSNGQLGPSLHKDVISIPNAVSMNSDNGLELPPGSISALPVKLSSSLGPAESSFLSSVGTIAEKVSTDTKPDSVSLRKIAAIQNESPSVNYAAEKVLAAPVSGQSTSYNPTVPTSQASIDKFLSTPASDLGLLGSEYNRNPKGILSSSFLGTPISSIFGLTGKELSTDESFSVSNIANNGNSGGLASGSPLSAGNKDDPLEKFQIVIQHQAPANTAASTAFGRINNNNLFHGLNGNGIFSDPLGFPNGLFGNTYNGINSFGGASFGANDIFSKYLWR